LGFWVFFRLIGQVATVGLLRQPQTSARRGYAGGCVTRYVEGHLAAMPALEVVASRAIIRGEIWVVVLNDLLEHAA
jgi:hypothetical protein